MECHGCEMPLNELPFIGKAPRVNLFTLFIVEIGMMNDLVSSLCHLRKRRKYVREQGGIDLNDLGLS